MTPRSRALTIGGVWGLLVTAALVAFPLSVRDRLPDPLATHWTPDGPDGSQSLTVVVLAGLALWVVTWALLMGLAVHGSLFARRLGRIYWWGSLFGMSVFALGMAFSTLVANLDRPSWQEATLLNITLTGTAVLALGAGVLGGYLGRGEPDQPRPPAEAPPQLRLRQGQRSVWVGRTANPWLQLMAAVPVVVIVVMGGLQLFGVGMLAVTLAVSAAMVAVFIAGIVTSSISVRVTEDGVAIGFGPLGWPVRRIRLSAIDTAWAEQRFPSQVGGWGLRGLPGSASIMLRGGECLVLRYRSGGQLVISIDDAERGAALINALIEERVSH